MIAAQEQQPITLRFAGAVNGAAFECGKNYSNIGTTKSTITPSDFRFFVSAVELLTQEGKAVGGSVHGDIFRTDGYNLVLRRGPVDKPANFESNSGGAKLSWKPNDKLSSFFDLRCVFARREV
ncbi:MAG: hypothetical protein FJ145_26365 [Deltaproteobacteria bacterium]|nr:hypothetical protein [Deltaproteobacteria bacterium]